jgi:hypothetical protein
MGFPAVTPFGPGNFLAKLSKAFLQAACKQWGLLEDLSSDEKPHFHAGPNCHAHDESPHGAINESAPDPQKDRRCGELSSIHTL